MAGRDGRITGYTTGLNYFGHSVAESNRELQALIGAAESLGGPGFLVPTRNASLFRWCLEHGLRVVQPNTLMSMVLYNEPSGAWIPAAKLPPVMKFFAGRFHPPLTGLENKLAA